VKRAFVATKHAGKLRELRQIFARVGYDLATYDGYADVEEGDTSYRENAALKARALRAQLVDAGIHEAVLGDDSGLEVIALDDRPGVLSARYGGDGVTWADRRRALLAELDATGSEDRTARFVCVLHLIDVDGREYAGRGDFTGSIAIAERGEAGFSYDPIFELPDRGLTFAEIDETEKNRTSHRARAATALFIALEADAHVPEHVPLAGNESAAGM
jgi:XTP/dITP diphosphohydrolase